MALDCGGGASYPTLSFSRRLGQQNPGLLRRLVRINPTVAGITPEINGEHVIFKGRYRRDTLYRMTLQAQDLPLLDDAQQPLQHRGEQSVYFYLGKKQPFLRWERGQGILERFGPQMMPLHARGIQKLDLRIHPIKPEDRRFWPFPKQAFSFFEDLPVRAGEAKKKPHTFQRAQTAERLVHAIKSLGAPRFSRIINLPSDPEGEGHRFGLDLSPYLQPFFPTTAAPSPDPSAHSNHFLIGSRRLDGSHTRDYTTIQITDIALSAVEEKDRVVFAATSLKDASPLAQAQILLEGSTTTAENAPWRVLWKGKTDAQGIAILHRHHRLRGIPQRLRVIAKDDQLVLDPQAPPPVFVSNHWFPSSERWLGWLNDAQKQPPAESFRAHLFTERPVYRPGESVHIKGIVRALVNGQLRFASPAPKLRLRLRGPQGRVWDYDTALSSTSSFYQQFLPQMPPVGSYSATLYRLHDHDEIPLASRFFRIEEYRVPQFEVKITAPEKTPADQTFTVSAMARYYAGGMVIEQPVKWRVVEEDIRYTPQGMPGYLFASSFRYGQADQRQSRVIVSQSDKLDSKGIALLKLDPTRSLELRPRRFNIEAVVTGTDGRDIAHRQSVQVLPPFNVGVKIEDRFRLQPGAINASIIALGLEGKPLAKIPMEVELLRREWHAQLVETDFVQGGVKYRTEIVDKLVASCPFTSQLTPASCPLKAERAGVYILRVKARDKIGRLQSISVDMYIRGKERLTWEQPEASVFQLTLDKKTYQVGDKARVLLRSPFQEARALAIIEDPAGTRYQWLTIQAGQGLLEIPITTRHAPHLGVHLLLMRGRIAKPQTASADPGRPQSVASSIKIPVSPREHLAMIALNLPERARPRQEVEIEITLTDADKKPIAGEVTLMAVDRAVLSLGHEGALDPLSAFVKAHSSNVRLRDTRNLVLGRIARRPDSPGGDTDGMRGGIGMMIRRNFKAVAYYNPSITVDASGRAKIRFALPDDLTTFSIRAIATSEAGRFGYAKRSLLVNLPVMIQPALPRFARPGDRLTSGGIARIAEGDGGAATISIQAKGLHILGESQRTITLNKQKPTPASFSLHIPTRHQKQAQITMRLQRKSDKEQDAFTQPLPIQPDNKRVYFVKEQLVSSLATPLSLAQAWPEDIRPGSGRIEIIAATRSETIRAIAAMEELLDYPFGCTEQRVSQAFPLLVLEQTMRRYALSRLNNQRAQQAARATVQHLASVINAEGLYSYWSGAQGDPFLTAYILNFLIEARRAGIDFPDPLIERPVVALRQALRSDYSWQHDTHRAENRAEILQSLANAGFHEPEYLRRAFNERNQVKLDLFGRSRLLLAMHQDRLRHKERINTLQKELWAATTIQSQDGRLTLQGIQFLRKDGWRGYYLASQTRTLAAMLEALTQTDAKNPKITALKDALLDQRIAQRLGFGWIGTPEYGYTWGSTQDNARALLALRSYLEHQPKQLPQLAFFYTPRDKDALRPLFNLGGERHAAQATLASDAIPAFQINADQPLQQPLWMRVRFSYIPQTPGAKSDPINKGFSLIRNTTVFNAKNQPTFFEIKANTQQTVQQGHLLEEEIRVLSDRYHYHVAIEIPLAAGLEIMNPNLRTTADAAKTSQPHSITPTHTEYRSDRVRFFFETLPPGQHKLFFRTRATTQGSFTYPPANVELMYQPHTLGRSPGYTLSIKP
jgi:uncharacterized protein YfaS (alpha-2-macroglobulin family)